MRDYFAEFLLNPKAPVNAAPIPPPIPPKQFGKPLSGNTPIKHYILWALTAVAIAIASWKASQWFASHKFLSNQAKG